MRRLTLRLFRFFKNTNENSATALKKDIKDENLTQVEQKPILLWYSAKRRNWAPSSLFPQKLFHGFNDASSDENIWVFTIYPGAGVFDIVAPTG